MSIVRTARGTVTDKSSGLTLTIADVQLDEDCTLQVGLGYDTGQGGPVVTWGQQTLEVVRTVAGGGIAARVVSHHRKAPGSRTHDLVATWIITAPTAKVMVATQVTEVAAEDIVNSQAESAMTDPDSGAGVTTNTPDEFLWGICVSEGPSTDTVGTAQNGFTSGQRAGTTGGGAASNVTVHEIYKITTATESAQAAKTGATSRDWATILVTFKAGKDFRVAISPTDLDEMRNIFDNKVPSLPRREHCFHWNPNLDRWEMFQVNLVADGALIAHRDSVGAVAWMEI